MNKTHANKTIALAGIFQTAYLVDQIATKGLYDTSALESSITSILKVDADDIYDVYGGLEGVATGLSVLIKQLSAAKKDVNLQITRYVLGILYLENKLNQTPGMLQKIADKIGNATLQTEHFHITHDNVLANLASIYTDTVSTIKPQIMVEGDHGFLNTPENANKIRALLLSGIRSAVLWRQSGGSRWQILFKRKSFITEAKKIIDTLRQ